MDGNQQPGAHGPERGRIPVYGKPTGFMAEAEKIEAIIDHACGFFGITRHQLCGKHRNGKLVNARVLVSNALHQLTDLSYPAIGRLLHRDHSTIMFHINHAHKPVFTVDGNPMAWPPTWVAVEIARMRRLLMKEPPEPPTWELLHDLGEALGFINPAMAAQAGIRSLAKAA